MFQAPEINAPPFLPIKTTCRQNIECLRRRRLRSRCHQWSTRSGRGRGVGDWVLPLIAHILDPKALCGTLILKVSMISAAFLSNLCFHFVSSLFDSMPAPAPAENGTPRTELQDLQVKSQQVTDEVSVPRACSSAPSACRTCATLQRCSCHVCCFFVCSTRVCVMLINHIVSARLVHTFRCACGCNLSTTCV